MIRLALALVGLLAIGLLAFAILVSFEDPLNNNTNVTRAPSRAIDPISRNTKATGSRPRAKTTHSPDSTATAVADVSRASERPALVERFVAGEDWNDHLRRIKRAGGNEALLSALDSWIEALTGAGHEPSRVSLVLGRSFVKYALGRKEEAAKDIEEAICSLPLVKGSLMDYRMDIQSPWPLNAYLVPIPMDCANTAASSPQCVNVHSFWRQDLEVLPSTLDDPFNHWLLDVSKDRTKPEQAMSASVLWHLLWYSESLMSGPQEGPASEWRQLEDDRGRYTRDVWRSVMSDRPLGDDALHADLRASLRAHIWVGFSDVKTPRAEQIQLLVRLMITRGTAK